jgi:hypothetical protein
MLELRRKLFAETLGTALLLAIVIGSGIMAERLAGGNAAVALLANTLATMCGLYVLIVCRGRGHSRFAARHPARAGRSGRGDGGGLHRRGVLVHRVHVVRQPGGGFRAHVF